MKHLLNLVGCLHRNAVSKYKVIQEFHGSDFLDGFYKRHTDKTVIHLNKTVC